MKKNTEAYIYLAPVVIGLVVFTAGPIASTLYLSFTHWDLSETPKWVGGGNYQELTSSSLFWDVVLNTFYYVLLYVPLCVGFSLFLALTIRKKIPGHAIFRTIYFLPVVTSMVAAALIWNWLYNSDIGLLNFLLSKMGIAGPRWLESPAWAMPAIVLMSIWKNAGYFMMILLAGLLTIPQELYEAARIDGSSHINQFRSITLPLVMPILFFVIIMCTISGFQVFEQTYVLTHGGPANATLTLSFYIWQTAFQFFDMGRASAMAYLMFLLLAALTYAQFQLRKRLLEG